MAETKTDPLDFHTLTERLEADPTAFRADEVRAEVAAELRRQAAGIRRRINSHGAGMRHGCDVGRSNYCEAWERDEAMLLARARELEAGE